MYMYKNRACTKLTAFGAMQWSLLQKWPFRTQSFVLLLCVLMGNVECGDLKDKSAYLVHHSQSLIFIFIAKDDLI